MANYTLVRKLFSQVAVFSLVGVMIVVSLPCNSYSAPSGKVIIGFRSDLTPWLDPLQAAGGTLTILHLQVFEGLVGTNWKGEIVPKLCTSYEISNDMLTYTFHLRKGVKFHNGEPMTAEDIKYWIDRTRDPKTRAKFGGLTKKIREVEIVDPYTVKLHLSGIDAFLINKLSFVCAGGIVSKKLGEKHDAEWLNRNAVGTGPYKIVSVVTGESITLEANESYWGGVPAVKTIECRTIPESASRMAALKAGEVDIVAGVPTPELKGIKDDPRFNIVTAPGGEHMFVAMNGYYPHGNPVFKDVRVRKAFNYAVNKKEMIEKLYLDTSARACGGFATPSVPWYDPNLKVMYDPEKAKQLLKEANFDFNQTFDMAVPEGRFNMGKEVALVIADNLAAVGVKVNVKMITHSQWNTEILKENCWPMTFMNYTNTTWSPDAALIYEIHSNGGWSYLINPELDKMIDDLLLVTDPAQQIEKTKLIMKKVYDEATVIFLWEVIDSWAVKKNIDFRIGGGERPHFFEGLKINP